MGINAVNNKLNIYNINSNLSWNR